MFAYFQIKDFERSLQEAIIKGGKGKPAAEKVQALLHRLKSEEDPFRNFLRTTHHGESRIAHCVKYDLPMTGVSSRSRTTTPAACCSWEVMTTPTAGSTPTKV
ncbi:hypothetical protein [Rubellimicrobium mesophilum]|uniref:hypothetical protein n=1 Tax=Rubellimicrobium mesophilum TaxID=1123067 RepID=UPI0006884B30|nr:hypothetical protein [Rubellimicrobium mesophilum]